MSRNGTNEARLLNIEQNMKFQNQINTMHSLGIMGRMPPNPFLSGSHGLWPGGSQMMHTTYPHFAYSIPHQGFPMVP